MKIAHGTDDPQIDRLLHDLLKAIELCLPGRLHSAYLAGSYAERCATPLSDLDVTFVFHGQLEAAEREQLNSLRGTYKQRAPLSLDLTWLSEHELARLAVPNIWDEPLLIIHATTLAHSSQLLAGIDLRPTIPAVPLATYTRARMHFPYQVLAGPRGHPASLSVPLLGPDPDDEFLGYTGRRLRARDGHLHPSTKRLVHGTGFIATALLALAGQIVGSRRDAMSAYRRWIDDEWAGLLEDVQHFCGSAWNYAVPSVATDRAILRALCQRGLAFENAFLMRYKHYLLDELRQPDPLIQRFALQRLSQIRYDDPAVVAALHHFSSSDPALQTAASEAMHSYDQARSDEQR